MIGGEEHVGLAPPAARDDPPQDEKSTRDAGYDLARVMRAFGANLALPEIEYDGSEGELYDVRADPHHWRNLWSDPGCARLKSDLITDLYDHLPAPRTPALAVDAPA